MTQLTAIDHVQIAMPAGEEEKARQYYGALLGLPEVAKPPKLSGRGGCWFEYGAIKLHLGVEPEFRPAKKAHVALTLKDADALRKKLKQAGFPVREDDAIDNVTRFFSEDPFGNRIEFIETV